MSDAQRKSPELAAVLAWLAPGLGHVYLGQKAKGLIAFAIVTGLFATGFAVTKGEIVSWHEHPYAFFGQVGAGLYTIAGLTFARGGNLAATPQAVVPWLDLGILYTCVAGLLNVLLVLDAVDFSLGGPDRRAAERAAEGEGADAA